MSITKTNDSKHWRDRAVKMRAIVVTMKDTHAHILMNDLADDYDNLADDRERQAVHSIAATARDPQNDRVHREPG
jgi:hypothetical protein